MGRGSAAYASKVCTHKQLDHFTCWRHLVEECHGQYACTDCGGNAHAHVIKTNHLNNGGRVFSDAKAKIHFHKQRRVGLITGFLKVGGSHIGGDVSPLITTRN